MGRRPPEEIIQTNNRLILVRNEEIKKAPDDIKASKMDTNGMLSKSIAGQYLLLSNIDETRKWFTESTRYYQQSIELKRKLDIGIDTGYLFEMFISSVLSGNEDLKKEVSQNIIENPPKGYDLVVFGANLILLFAMIARDHPETGKQQEIFNELVKKYAKRLSGYLQGERETLEALTKKDRAGFLDGIHAYLKSFPRSGYHKDFPLSLYGAVFIILAKDRSMDIDPERDIDKKYHKYIPMGLLKSITETGK